MHTFTPRARLALLLGPVLVLVGLSLQWYAPSVARVDTVDTFTGWTGSDALDLYLVFVVAAAWLLLIADARGTAIPNPARTGVDVATGLAVALVLYRIVSPPDDLISGFSTEVSLSAGPFVSGAGLLLLVAALRPSA